MSTTTTAVVDLCKDADKFKPLQPYLSFYRMADFAFAGPETLAEPFPRNTHLRKLARLFFFQHSEEGDEPVDIDTHQGRGQVLAPTKTLAKWNTLDLSSRYTSSKINLTGEKQISSLKDDIVGWLQDIPDKSVRCLNLAFCNLLDGDLTYVAEAAELLQDKGKVHDNGLVVTLRGSRFHDDFDGLKQLLHHCRLVDICTTPMASIDNKGKLKDLHTTGVLDKVLFIPLHFRLDAALLDTFGPEGLQGSGIEAAADAARNEARKLRPPPHDRTAAKLYRDDLYQRLEDVRAEVLTQQEKMNNGSGMQRQHAVMRDLLLRLASEHLGTTVDTQGMSSVADLVRLLATMRADEG
ncbi:hypothetical protein PTSG_01259 [Salpingoeca rosetta]|uniref:Uncharacterized protein n=1 Tax=Salpingoeca rosetta (strain ATCC 50818 / BSB-021) TaxID=946362 RepID=F2TZU1_SALR5|nr:uncharacterized protein PTSG_01259 [Salpingoeca rosetta]EGD80669.1 hypothetical protein PTSG_01259 [Salpingoeca rosetta]|eukprot:XP_004997230.1 hypothetical protein PTSG_01259 [Salpingoeca rosetta]